MKTKFKEFVKKIKNWLSSLSKWAQKHKLKIFTIICSSFLLISSVVTCTNNKKSASAQALYSDDMVFVTTPFTAYSEGGVPLTVLPFFFGYDSTRGMFGSFVDVPISQNWQTGAISYARYYLTYEYINDYYIITPNFDFVVRNSDNTNSWFAQRDDIGNAISHLSVGFDTTIYNGNIVEFFFNNASRYTVNVDKDDIIFQFYDFENDPVCYITLARTKKFTAKDNSLTTSLTFLSSHTSRTAVAEELLQNAYTNGYNIGYNNAYQLAYDIGFNDGIEYSTDPTHFEPFYILTRGVSNFLNTQILGSITLGTLLSIGLGCILFGFAIKIFLGG